MPAIRSNGIEIFYDEFGPQDAPPLLLVMGLGAQMIAWPTAFCEQLVALGFRVIRFDNRDVGLSTKTDGNPPTFSAGKPGGPLLDISGARYSLSDMASDAVGVLDHLGIDKAHIVGASMGGMISQRIVIDHPDRVLSLTSIMSTTGNPAVGAPTPEAMAVLFTPPPTERDAVIENSVKSGAVISGPLFDPELARVRAGEAFDRCFNPAGAAFQIAAIMSDGDRTELLGGVTVPTLVIHGTVDTLVTFSGGEATAAAIPGAELLALDEMGHDMPEALWPQITDAIAKVALKEEKANA